MHKLAAIFAIIFLTARLAVADTNNAITAAAAAMSAPPPGTPAVAQTPAPAPAAVTASAPPAEPAITREEVADNFLHIQEQLHETQLAIEQSQKAQQDAAQVALQNALQSNNAAMQAKLDALEADLAQQRAASAAEAHKTQNATLYMAGTLGLVGLGMMLLMVYFQWRAFTQLAQISQQQHAALSVSNGVHHLAAPGRAQVEAANAQLLDAVGRLENRINELEGGQRYLPEINTNGHGKPPAAQPPVNDLLAEGQQYLDTNAPQKALECFEKFLAENPNRADGLVKRAAALEKLGRDDEAVDCYNRAIEADNTLVIAHLHKGGLLNRLRRYDEALNCYEQALQAQEKKAVAGRA